jgi:hypothetical protein
MMALHRREREAGLQVYGDGDGIDRRLLARIEHRWRDVVAIGDGIGNLYPSLPAGREIDRLHDRLREVARRHHQRHPQRELVAGLPHRLLVLDLHDHGVARPDIGDRIGEDVRPLLLDKAGLLARGLRLLVDLAGLLPVLDVPDDDALSDHHLQGVDRRSLRQWIDVEGRHVPWRGSLGVSARGRGEKCRNCNEIGLPACAHLSLPPAAANLAEPLGRLRMRPFSLAL